MTQERKTRLATMAVLVLALGVALGQKSGWHFGRSGTPVSRSPQDSIFTMLGAARNGNVAAYLASYTGPMRQSLEGAIRETSDAAFSKYLRDSSAAIRGVAISDPQISGDEAIARVEYVYQDRNEAQIMHLNRAGSDWKIARVDGTERVKTLVPYGTPAQ